MSAYPAEQSAAFRCHVLTPYGVRGRRRGCVRVAQCSSCRLVQFVPMAFTAQEPAPSRMPTGIHAGSVRGECAPYWRWDSTVARARPRSREAPLERQR